jgi:hypothetical protein
VNVPLRLDARQVLPGGKRRLSTEDCIQGSGSCARAIVAAQEATIYNQTNKMGSNRCRYTAAIHPQGDSLNSPSFDLTMVSLP